MVTRAENRHTKLYKVGNASADAASLGITIGSRVANVSQLKVIAAAAAGSASATGLGLVVAGGVLQVIGIGKNSVAAVKSHRHMKGLSELAKSAPQFTDQCSGDANNHTQIVKEVLPYIIGQKKTKRDRRAVKTIPGVGLLESIKAGLNKARKHCNGTLGKKRTLYAEMLAAHLIMGNCRLSELIVAELYDCESMEWIKNHCEIFPASELLAEKMKSR